MSPENQWLEDLFPTYSPHFRGRIRSFSGVGFSKKLVGHKMLLEPPCKCILQGVPNDFHEAKL